MRDRSTGRTWASAIGRALLSVTAVVALTGASRWQGGAPPPIAEQPGDGPRPSSFLVLDTGGSGGMFGKGDLRQDLMDVAFWTDGRRGAACGKGGVFRSVDGGLTWGRIRNHARDDYPRKPGVTYYSLELSGPDEIWVAEGEHPHVGRSLWRSTDAGDTWEDVAPRLPGAFESTWDLLARGPRVWVLGGWSQDANYRTDDGGKTWQRLELPEGFEAYRAVTPADAPLDTLGTVYLFGARRIPQQGRAPELWRSDDAGATWRAVSLPEWAKERWQLARDAIAFATAEDGMIALSAAGLKHIKHGVWEKTAGESVSLLITDDGGRTWTRRDLPNEEPAPKALWQDPSDPRHAFIAVLNGWQAQHGKPRLGPAMYETFDAGRAWVIALRGKPQINMIYGLDARRVWAVGNSEGFQANDVVAVLKQAGSR